MNSLKYYAVSFGVLMALTGSAIVLADEVEEEPVILEEKEEVSYVFEFEEKPVMEEPEVITPEENVEIVTQEDPIVEEVSNPIVVEEVPAEDPASGPVLRTPAGVWGSDENGTYYVVSGQKLKDTVTDIDGYYYGFKPTGYLYMDQRFQWNTYWYQAKEDGKLCEDEWYQQYDVDYYYGDMARGADGLQSVDGQNYYFKDGRKVINSAFEWNGDPYYVDDTGKVTYMSTDGWYYVPMGTTDMNTYLVVNGSFINSGMYYYNNSYYYFYQNGQLARNTTNIVHDITPFYVRSKDSGELYEEEWYYEKEYGEKYYYGFGARSAEGFTTINGQTYYFEYGGKLKFDTAATLGMSVYIFQENGSYSIANTDGWYNSGTHRYYVSNGHLLTDTVRNEGSDSYYFTGDGHVMVNDVLYSSTDNCYYGSNWEGKLVKNGFFRDYYFGADGKSLSDGFVNVEGFDYFIEYGRYLTNTIRSINGVNYIFDLAGTASVAKEGITENVNTYYVLNGELATGFFNIDGKDAYFEAGIMLKNGIIQVSDHEYMVADREGNLLKDSFYTFDYSKSPIFKYDTPSHPLYFYGTVYLDSEGKVVDGLKVIDGRTYIFGSEDINSFAMYTDELFKYNDQWYKANSNGVCQYENTWSGWVQAGTTRYFMNQGEIVKNQLYEIAGSTYAFDMDGKLIRNGFWSAHNPKYNVYRTDADGKIIRSQWVTVENEGMLNGEYYFNSDGTSPDDFTYVGGKTYYFDHGRKVVSEIRAINGVLFRFKEDGTFTTTVPDGEYEGWTLQVVRNGVLVTNEIYAYQGSYYMINGAGYALKGNQLRPVYYLYECFTPYYVYISESGPLKRIPQITHIGMYDYFPTDAGNMVYGFLDNYFGNQYAVVRETDGHGGLYTYALKNSRVTIKGINYYADSNGILHQVLLNGLHSLSLEDNIGVNFYYSFTNFVLDDAGAKVEFTIDGITTDTLVSNTHRRAMGGFVYNIFTKEVTSVQLASNITAKIILSNGDVVYKEEYKAKDYCDQVINSITPDAGLKNLMKALLNYGGYAQIAFNYNTDNLANKDLTDTDVSDVTAATLQPYALTTSGGVAGLNYTSSSLALNSATAINHIFTLKSGHTIDEYTFTLGDEVLTPIKRGNKYYIVIPEIYSKDLDTPFTVKVGSFRITYSALSYAYKALISDAASPELKDLARALYKYSQAANNFYGA